MGIFKKVKGAKSTGNFKYFDPDFEGVVLITNVKADETRTEDPFVAATCRIVTSNLESHKPGQERSWYVDMTKDAAPGNIRQFVIEATRISEEEFDGMSDDDAEEACDAIVGEDQPCANLLISLRTGYNKKKTFTVHTWSRVPEDKIAEYAAKARELGVLDGPLCDMQKELDEQQKKPPKKAA